MPCHSHASKTCSGARVGGFGQEPVEASTKSNASGYFPYRNPKAATSDQDMSSSAFAVAATAGLSVVPHRGVGCNPSRHAGSAHGHARRRSGEGAHPPALTSGVSLPHPCRGNPASLGCLEGGHVLEVRFDDPEALEDLPPMLARHGHRVLSIEEVAGDWRMCIEVVP